MSAEFLAILFVGAGIFWAIVTAANENEKRLNRIIELLAAMNDKR